MAACGNLTEFDNVTVIDPPPREIPDPLGGTRISFGVSLSDTVDAYFCAADNSLVADPALVSIFLIAIQRRI